MEVREQGSGKERHYSVYFYIASINRILTELLSHHKLFLLIYNKHNSLYNKTMIMVYPGELPVPLILPPSRAINNSDWLSSFS